jgi:hypothetical protein
MLMDCRGHRIEVSHAGKKLGQRQGTDQVLQHSGGDSPGVSRGLRWRMDKVDDRRPHHQPHHA